MRYLLLAFAIATTAACGADSTPADSRPADTAAAPATPAASTTPTAPATPPDAPEPQATATVPSQFQGTWALDAAACAFAGHESRLVIGADRIQFHESSGTVTSVMSSGSDLTVVAGLAGEGTTREATYRFRLSGDGSTLTDVSSGTGMVRHRC